VPDVFGQRANARGQNAADVTRVRGEADRARAVWIRDG